MTTPDALAARPDACSACGGPLDPLGGCPRCGAAFGEAYRCPLCHAISGIEASPTVQFCCRTCGGPRIPPSSSPVSEAEVALLQRARGEQLRATAFQGGAAFAVASGVLSLLVTSVVLLAISPPAFAKFAALLASAVPFVLSVFALRRGRQHLEKLEAALQQAWVLAASRLAARSEVPMTAAALARDLRVDEARAELLLAEVSLQDFVQPTELPARMRVTDLSAPDDLAAAAEPAKARAAERNS